VNKLITLEKIQNASQNLSGVVINSTFEKVESYSAIYHSNIFFKREDLQKVRSFKIRGAYNKIISLRADEVKNGIVCASAGNHAQGFAVSCEILGYKGKVFMPVTTPNQKINQVKKFGKKNIEVVLIGENFSQAYHEAKKDCKINNKTFIHPFDDLKVIEGQATVFLEILNHHDKMIDYLFVPIGGGGLISGAINVFKQLSPQTKIIGIEPLGAPSMLKSIQQNQLVTLEKINAFVDGAAVKKVGTYSFNFCKDYLDELILVDEGEICKSILDLKKIEGITAEPAGAMSTAALRQFKNEIFNKNVVCLICGGNNDELRMPEIRMRAKEWMTNNPDL
tara:strand:+ start:77 stop:1084 length:1008 start_codon:yes stop_codon:yes gene_type:complete